MALYDVQCFHCGAEKEEYRPMSECDKCTPCKCGGEFRIVIKKAPPIGGSLDGDFTPHYDHQAGRHFQHADQKRNWLKETGKVQLGGDFSPKPGSKDRSQVKMTASQARNGFKRGDL